MMLHECNLLVIGKYHIQKPNQALGSMEQCASINEPKELLGDVQWRACGALCNDAVVLMDTCLTQ